MDGGELESAWRRLRNAVRECVRPGGDVRRMEFMPLYSAVYKLCSPAPQHSADAIAATRSHSAALYALLRAQLFVHARACARLLLEVLPGAPRRTREPNDARVDAEADALRGALARAPLARYAALWRAYCSGIRRIAALFAHLDTDWIRQHLASAPRVLDVRSTALVAWRDELITPVAAVLVDTALADVSARRSARVYGTPAPARPLQHIRILLDSIVKVGATDLIRSDDSSSSCSSDASADDLSPHHLASTLSLGASIDAPLTPLPPELCAASSAAAAYPGFGYTALAPPNPLRATARDREPRELCQYRTLFETSFLQCAAQFYAAHAAHVLDDRCLPVREYVVAVAAAELERELEFASHFTHSSTLPLLRAVLQRELVGVHRTRLIDAASALLCEATSGGGSSIESGALQHLRALYKLIAADEARSAPLADVLRRRVQAAGTHALRPFVTHDGALDALLRAGATAAAAENEQLSPATRFACAAWQVVDVFQTIVDQAMACDAACQRALNQACERFLNVVDAAPMLLAQFLHERLETRALRGAALDGVVRQGETTAAVAMLDGFDDDVWAQRAARLFRYLGDKALFQRVYAARLARRLVYETSRSPHSEQTVLVHLAKLCGADYTTRLKRMFADVEASIAASSAFPVEGLTFELEVLVLSSGTWPRDGCAADIGSDGVVAQGARRRTDGDAFVALPGRIGVACAQFVQHYVDAPAHSRRRLTWDYALCRVWIDARDVHGKVVSTLEVTVTQAVIVLHFNDTCRATPRTLAAALGLPLADITPAVDALVDTNVLSRLHHHIDEPVTVAPCPGNGNALIRVALVAAKPAVDNGSARQRTSSAADGDRRTQTQAAVVSAMKTHKQLSDAALFELVTCHLRPWFILDYTDYVRNVESLIENEYMTRCDLGYAYVA